MKKLLDNELTPRRNCFTIVPRFIASGKAESSVPSFHWLYCNNGQWRIPSIRGSIYHELSMMRLLSRLKVVHSGKIIL